MLNKTTLLTAITFALTGCGGGSSSGTSIPDKQPQPKVDYPIHNATFSPSPSTQLSYTFTVDGQAEGEMRLRFQAMTAEQLLTTLSLIPASDELSQQIHDLVNYGVEQFYYSEEQLSTGEEDDTLYFAGIDGALHEVSEAYQLDPRFTPRLMYASPLFRLSGTDVRENDPNIDISEETLTLQTRLTAQAIQHLLGDFDQHEWVQNLPMTTSCLVTWQQQIGETGARKTFTVSGKVIEAAFMTEQNSYYLNCDDMDSMEFSAAAERWFNPSLGLIEQTERQQAQQKPINETKVQLSKLETH